MVLFYILQEKIRTILYEYHFGVHYSSWDSKGISVYWCLFLIFEELQRFQGLSIMTLSYFQETRVIKTSSKKIRNLYYYSTKNNYR